MDLKNILSSSIQSSNTDTYFVQFPSFTGYVEAVFYNHEWAQISEWADEVEPIFQSKRFVHNTHSLVLVSRILSHVGVRIFDTDRIYEEKIFIIEGGELISFEIMGSCYLALIYRDTFGKLGFYTNLPSDLPFRGFLEKNTFYIENTNFLSIVFTHEIDFVRANMSTHSIPKNKIESQKILYVPDPIFQESQAILRQLLLMHNAHEYSEDGILSCDFSGISEHDFIRLVWFLGMYTTVLSENVAWIHGYKTLQDVRDGRFEMPTEFEESETMNSLDARWHTLRMSLLEIEYLLFSLVEHLKNLSNWIDAIDKLENVHIISARKRLEMNEEGIRSILPKYLFMKDLLISSLKSKLHN